MNNAPIPSPDDADLLSFGHYSVYRRSTGKWLTANVLNADGPSHLDTWATGASDELAFALPHGGHGGSDAPSLLAPAVERPPFNDWLLVRVTGAGTCLNLREGPGLEYPSIDCLPDGTRAGISERPGMSFRNTGSGPWVRLITDTGVEGWVSAAYLAWDLER